jgi:hypothetical protein
MARPDAIIPTPLLMNLMPVMALHKCTNEEWSSEGYEILHRTGSPHFSGWEVQGLMMRDGKWISDCSCLGCHISAINQACLRVTSRAKRH